jgi:hypothetical protein
LPQYTQLLRDLTKRSNAVLFGVVEDLLDSAVGERPPIWTTALLHDERQRFLEQLLRIRNEFVEGNRSMLMKALHPEDYVEAATA